jgi:hypothetical protein
MKTQANEIINYIVSVLTFIRPFVRKQPQNPNKNSFIIIYLLYNDFCDKSG